MSQFAFKARYEAVRLGTTALVGTSLIMLLPFLGRLNITFPVWVTITAMVIVYGLTLLFIARYGEKGTLWAWLIAVIFGGVMAASSYDERLRIAANDLGPIAAKDIARHGDALAYLLIEGSFEVGELEGWHEVCGDESCTEYYLLSLTLPGQSTKEPIDIWFQVPSDTSFGPYHVFQRRASTPSVETGVRRACNSKSGWKCSPKPVVLVPIDPNSGVFLSSTSFYILGLIAGVFWLFPCFIAWIRASFFT